MRLRSAGGADRPRGGDRPQPDFILVPSGGMYGPKANDPIVQARSKENRIPIAFVHPAEFLVTGPDGSILDATVLGDRLLVPPGDAGGAADRNRVFTWDLRPGGTP